MFRYIFPTVICFSMATAAISSYAQELPHRIVELCQRYPEDIRCLDPASKSFPENSRDNYPEPLLVDTEILDQKLNLFGQLIDLQHTSESGEVGKPMGSVCKGYFSPTPNHSLLVNEEISFFAFEIESDEEVFLRIVDPNQRVRCLFGQQQQQQQLLTGGVEEGLYDIYVGTRSLPPAETEYELTVSNTIHAYRGDYSSFLLSPGFTPEVDVGTGLSGGSVLLMDTIDTQIESVGTCSGYIAPKPNHIVILDSHFEFLNFSILGTGDSSLVIRDEDNTSVWCESGDRASISGEFLEGVYEVFIGNSESSQTGDRYQLLISELTNSQLIGVQDLLPPGSLVSEGDYARRGGSRERTEQTIEIEWGPYLATLQSAVEQQWFPANSDRSLSTSVIFTVKRDGSITDVRIGDASGNSDADESALMAIRSAAPFAPLPVNFDGVSVDIYFTFDLNVASRSHIRPREDVIRENLCRDFPLNSRCIANDSN